MTNNEAAKWIQLYIDLAKIDPTTGEEAYLNEDTKKTIEAMQMAISALTAQPETHEERTETHECDCISRQAAIDAVLKGRLSEDDSLVESVEECNSMIEWAADVLKNLPSAQPDVLACGEGELIAQPEIVRCKDCRYYQDNNGGYPHMNCKWDANETPDADDFCSGAERRTDE